MADNWDDSVWTVYPGSGPGIQPGGASCYRGLKQWISQRMETHVHTAALGTLERQEVKKLLRDGHALKDGAIRCLANMLLDHVNRSAYDFGIWYVRPNEIRAWAGARAWDLKEALTSSLQMMDIDGADIHVNGEEGRVWCKLTGTMERREVTGATRGWGSTKRVPRADNRLQHVRGLLLDWIGKEADEYVRLRHEAIKALDQNVVITRLQQFEGDQVTRTKS